MTRLSRLPILLTAASLLVAACGAVPSHEPISGGTNGARGEAADGNGAAFQGTLGAGSSPALGSPNGTGLPGDGVGHTATATTRPSATPGRSGGPTPTIPPSPPGSGSCPDPRYCGDYALSGGHWVADSTGRIVLHYRVNATNPPPANSTLSSQQIQEAIDAAAEAWMGADPRVALIDDGLTTDQPAFNDVVAFSPSTPSGNADIEPTCSGCNTYNLWDIKL